MKKNLYLTPLAALLIGCRSSMTPFSTLHNQGILPLSTSNPYVGANLFLAHEAEASPYLFNFLDARGAPSALQIEESGRVVMFYPRDKETYVAEQEISKEHKEWIVKGPYAIERKDYKRLARIDESTLDQPLSMVNGKQYTFKSERIDEHPRILSPSITVLPRPTPKPVVKKRAKEMIVAKGADINTAPARPTNLDQQAIAMSKGFAERSPTTGDVIHSVKEDSEPLSSIVTWYTGSGETEDVIAAANGLTKGAIVPKGTRITIPKKSVKNFKAKN